MLSVGEARGAAHMCGEGSLHAWGPCPAQARRCSLLATRSCPRQCHCLQTLACCRAAGMLPLPLPEAQPPARRRSGRPPPWWGRRSHRPSGSCRAARMRSACANLQTRGAHNRWFVINFHVHEAASLWSYINTISALPSIVVIVDILMTSNTKKRIMVQGGQHIYFITC